MRISRVTTTTVAILVGAAIAPVMPASAQNSGPGAPDRPVPRRRRRVTTRSCSAATATGRCRSNP